MNTREILDREFLEIRAKLLELAASFDRLQRADGDFEQDPRWERLRQAIEILGSQGPDQAEQIQRLFSRDYDPDWRQTFDLQPSDHSVG